MDKVLSTRAAEHFAESVDQLNRRTDLMFGALFIIQLVGGIIAALTIAPRTWTGAESSVHIHVWAGIALGGLLCSLPLGLIVFMRGHVVTRYVVACAQMMFSALLIHLSGGRIETHFHIFGSLAFLAFYRDWRLLIPATGIIAVDHLLRGVFWPESVFGVLASSPWRALEHAGWVIFEDVFLIASCVFAKREMRAAAQNRAELELAHALTERTVEERTRELRTKTAQLSESEERFRLAVSGSQHGVWDWDLDADRVYYAPRWGELLGVANEDLTDSPDEWFGRIASAQLAEFSQKVSDLRSGAITDLDTELEMSHTDGGTRWMLCRAAAHTDDEGRVKRLAGSLSDISELKAAQDRLRQIANHDRLTDLPNRAAFTDRVRRCLETSARDPDYGFAVLFGDFDGFKVVNDSLGHSVGDAMLVRAAKVLTNSVRTQDMVARLGGDEFAVLIENMSSHDEVAAMATHMVEAFRETYELSGNEVLTTLSLGVVMSRASYASPDEMLRDADAAMYQAKTHGKSRWQLFDESMHAASMHRVTIGQDLRRMTASMPAMDEVFALQYQPIVDLQTGEVAGFEALIRWNHPEHGFTRPDLFIDVAEETGAIIPLGEWTIRRASEWLVSWRHADKTARPMFVNANLSRRQLSHPDLIPMLQRSIRETGIRPTDLKLEITETTAIDPRTDVVPILKRIRELGVSLAIDDFGTGQSSLSCLSQFPIQTLKIDRAFLPNITEEREHSALIHAIVDLADNLGLDVVAEGIEDASQLTQLQAMDCGFGQGYYFSKPLDPAAAIELLRHGFPSQQAAA